jgi:hypothetical protein
MSTEKIKVEKKAIGETLVLDPTAYQVLRLIMMNYMN